MRELDCVRLTRRQEWNGSPLPIGTAGAIVHQYRDGTTYEVEVREPIACILTLTRDDIEPAIYLGGLGLNMR
jgi:hypothetical protein